jgi:DNA-binding Lrp family transcriptional regulator
MRPHAIQKLNSEEPMKAFVLINIRTGDVKEAVKSLRRIDGVLEACMTFGPYDAVAVIEVKDINAVGAILADQIQSIPGVLETLTCLAADV